MSLVCYEKVQCLFVCCVRVTNLRRDRDLVCSCKETISLSLHLAIQCNSGLYV
jgi:hypothetical protein